MERLKVEQLVKFYGLGHSPIREAIVILSSSGLVVHELERGYRVAPVSPADYDDVLNIYQRLYWLALEMAVDQGDEAWEERVVVQLHRSVKVAKIVLEADPEGRERWQRAYVELHSQMLSGCGSPLLLQLVGDIGGRLERYVNLFADLESDRQRNHHVEHRAIVDALIARDKERLRKLIGLYTTSSQPVRSSIVERLKRVPLSGSRRKAAPPTQSRPAARKPR